MGWGLGWGGWWLVGEFRIGFHRYFGCISAAEFRGFFTVTFINKDFS